MKQLKRISGYVAKDCKSIRFFSKKPHLEEFRKTFQGEPFKLWVCESGDCIQFPLGTQRPSINAYDEPIKVTLQIIQEEQ